MDTITIKIRNQKAIKLLQDLELLDLIRIIPTTAKTQDKLSDKMQGSISREQATDYYDLIDAQKNEWERVIY